MLGKSSNLDLGPSSSTYMMMCSAWSIALFENATFALTAYETTSQLLKSK
jgi:hypothetical protein